MRYRITSSTVWHSDKDKDKEAKEILSEYPCLKDFGWILVERTVDEYTVVRDENGKRIFQATPITVHSPYIEIDTLEEFQKLQAAIDNPLIFSGDEIEIYDGYRE